MLASTKPGGGDHLSLGKERLFFPRVGEVKQPAAQERGGLLEGVAMIRTIFSEAPVIGRGGSFQSLTGMQRSRLHFAHTVYFCLVWTCSQKRKREVAEPDPGHLGHTFTVLRAELGVLFTVVIAEPVWSGCIGFSSPKSGYLDLLSHITWQDIWMLY